MEIVYKFRDCENELHRRILTENEIYFAAPSSFNDPFDCRIDYNFEKLSKNEKIAYVNNQIQLLKEEAKLDIFEEMFIRKELTNILNNPKLLLDYQNEYNESNFKELNKKIGVFSCSKSSQNDDWKNILLWSHYANNHKGFCVGFDKLKLKECVDLDFQDGIVSKSGLVDCSKYPDLKPIVPQSTNKKTVILNFIQEITHKSNVWQYENEYRFIKIQTKNENCGLSENDRKAKLPKGVIIEVTLGINIDSWHKEEISEICKKNNIVLYQAEKEAFEFKIKRERIV